MIHKEKGLELARLIVIHWLGNSNHGILVETCGQIVNYNTQFSGSIAEMYQISFPLVYNCFADGKHISNSAALTFELT